MTIELPKNIKGTTKLNLSGKELSSIPHKVFEYKNLTKLILSDNNIRTIPSEINQLKHLKVLDVSHNNIKQIHAPIFSLPRLKILNISYNHIINLPKQIENSQIQFLIASSNKISNINVERLPKLKKLAINDNKVTSFIINNHNNILKYIWIGNNPLLNFSISNESQQSIRGIYTYTCPKKINYVSKTYRTLFSKRGNVRDFINSCVGVNDRQLMSQNNERNMPNKNVFIVHGHDVGTKESVARVLEKLNLKPIILHEQSDGGKTIIEKFEKNSSDVNFAIIILSADDKGKDKNDTGRLNYRARQNVVFEMGYFMAKLGRSNIFLLLDKGVEQPSDLEGIVYTLNDKGDSWKYKLVKELKACGYSVSADDL